MTKSARETTIEAIFENTTTMKRFMAGHWQTMQRDLAISHSQFELLFAIRNMQPVSFKQLAQQLYLTPSAVSQLAETLEQRELISRQSDAADRRVQYLEVSKKGNKLLKEIEKHRRNVMQSIMDDLDDEELALWLRVQEKVIRQFQPDTSEHTKKESK